MTTYTDSIANATNTGDPAMLELIEHFMREETGGALDHLDPRRFAILANQCHTDIANWIDIGAIDGLTLASYCEIMQMVCPRKGTAA